MGTLLTGRMTTHTSPTIWVDRDAYFYLNRISREQRGCKPLSEELEYKIWQRLTFYGKTDKYQLDNESMGGGDGTYNGRWWSWSVETLRNLLDDAGFKYEIGEDREYISI